MLVSLIINIISEIVEGQLQHFSHREITYELIIDQNTQEILKTDKIVCKICGHFGVIMKLPILVGLFW
jgi:hypothetical protein